MINQYAYGGLFVVDCGDGTFDVVDAMGELIGGCFDSAIQAEQFIDRYNNN